MTSAAPAANLTISPIPAALIARVNRLYHELTQPEFDVQHACRHRVEAEFWRRVARHVLVRTGCSVAGTAPGVESTARTVLDLACGTGFVSSILQSSLRAQDRLIAVDLSVPALRAAAAKVGQSADGRPGLCGLSAGGGALPLADHSIDLAAVNASLHHFADPTAALRELDRVLRDGGYLAIGFEPNLCHFRSAVLPRWGRAVDRVGWYLSLRQNRRRLAHWLGTRPRRASLCPSRCSGEFVTHAINRRLLVEHLVERPLSRENILDLVDPHARGARHRAGFDPQQLLAAALPGYRILELTTSDYLGETMRRLPRMRRAVDALMKRLLPLNGSLFCCLLQKGKTT